MYSRFFTFYIQLDFNKWMEELDRRAKSATGTSISTKKQIIGSPSQSLSPSDCPNWAINKDWTKGIHSFCCVHFYYYVFLDFVDESDHEEEQFLFDPDTACAVE